MFLPFKTESRSRRSRQRAFKENKKNKKNKEFQLEGEEVEVEVHRENVERESTFSEIFSIIQVRYYSRS